MGPQGKTGESAPRLHHWEAVAERYQLIGQLDDGTILRVIETRPLFQQFLNETTSG
jgi:hypothetical protein